ncbi:MAG TPA: ABC transporter permease [Bryobacteraceae bacterium]|jgi:lipoprotein-releasing system permease protein|nr:ABC transporter permease [Bryobacteraceae bacterium]
MRRFEWIVALRYLRAKRKQTVISVITVISIVGVTAGVAALIIALSINNGFANTLQGSLLSATAHVSIQERNPTFGIEDWQALIPQLARLRHVISVTPSLYAPVALRGPLVSTSATLKGVPLGQRAPREDMLSHLKAGSLAPFDDPERARSSIVLGSTLAQQAGVRLGSPVTVIGNELTPFSIAPTLFHFRVVGIFESGLYELDASWAFASLPAVQRVLDLQNVVNAIELRLDDVYQAPTVAREANALIGKKLIAQTWMSQNHSLLNALRLERIVSLITVGLIELVAALNILVVLVMLTMEKHRDIAILMSLGARRQQIRRIFLLQGLIIGSIGSCLGLIIGYSVALLFNHYRWLRLDEQIYSISYVPFLSRWTDGIWVAGLAILTSLIATIHPSQSASRIAPAEALRYE